MSDEAGPAGQAHPGSDEAEATAPDEKETEAAAQADALAKMEDQWRRALADADNVRKRAVRDGAQLTGTGARRGFLGVAARSWTIWNWPWPTHRRVRRTRSSRA